MPLDDRAWAASSTDWSPGCSAASGVSTVTAGARSGTTAQAGVPAALSLPSWSTAVTTYAPVVPAASPVSIKLVPVRPAAASERADVAGSTRYRLYALPAGPACQVTVTPSAWATAWTPPTTGALWTTDTLPAAVVAATVPSPASAT